MKESISKFTPAAVFILAGLFLFLGGLINDQTTPFILAGAGILLVGIITLLNALDKIPNSSMMIINVLLGVVVVYLIYSNYKSIDDPIQYLKEKERRYAYVVQSLKDIREAELAYKKENGTYTASFDTLINFLQNDSVTVVISDGVVPDTLTERQALEMGIIRRDTTRFPAAENVYNDEYRSTRFKKAELDVANLAKIPFSDEEFKLEAGKIERNNLEVDVFQCTDADPFDPSDVMQVGSMTDPSTAGNWKEEK